MDFFQRQDNARRKTKWLVLYFAGATLLTILGVYLVFALFSSSHSHRRHVYDSAGVSLWDPKLFLWVTGGTLFVVIAGSLYKLAELSQGGALVASSLGGRPLDLNSASVEEKRLRNVVEEMAIASGVPVPQIYLLPNEDGINAFAAGFTTSDAVIGVTQGAVQTLTRDELQGVIGHEFSHILNGDMRLNMRLIGVLNGILCIALCGRVLFQFGSQTRGSSRKNDPRGALIILGLALLAVGSIGMLFGRLIKSAISRQREFLADASAVQFTRNPLGLAGALKKIGGISQGSQLNAPNAEEASHLFFGNALSEGWSDMMATHPPLKERIRALDPAWDGRFPTVKVDPTVEILVHPLVADFPPVIPQALMAAAAMDSNRMVASAGTLTPRHVCYAAELRTAIPAEVRASARESLGACTIVYSLLVSEDENDRATQLSEFAASNQAGVYEETVRIYPTIAALDPRLKLPLVNLSLPALRQMSVTQYERFASNIRLLIESDRKIYLFEYMLQKVVLRHLAPIFVQVRKPVIQFYVLKPLEPDAVVLLSALARHGSDDPQEMEKAFRCGLAQLKFSNSGQHLLGAEDCDLPQIDGALNRCVQAAPAVKKSILTACAAAAAADGLLQAKEAEMLRAIADALDCPIPQFVENV